MRTFLADENFNGSVLRGLIRERPELDILRVQVAALSGADDPAVLDRAAQMGRILMTHDAATVPDFAFARVGAGLPMPGVLVIKRSLSIGSAVSGTLLVIELSFG